MMYLERRPFHTCTYLSCIIKYVNLIVELSVHFEVTSKNITEGESMSVDVVADDCYKGTFSLGITVNEGKATSSS